MKAEYEVVAEIINSCAGSGRPQRFFEEVELEDTDTYVKAKHGRDWDDVEKRPCRQLRQNTFWIREVFNTVIYSPNTTNTLPDETNSPCKLLPIFLNP